MFDTRKFFKISKCVDGIVILLFSSRDTVYTEVFIDEIIAYVSFASK